MHPFKKRIKTKKLIFANIDSLPIQLEYLREGISTVNIGQKPYDMGKWSAISLKMLSDGKTVPKIINTDLTYCTQARKRRNLHTLITQDYIHD